MTAPARVIPMGARRPALKVVIGRPHRRRSRKAAWVLIAGAVMAAFLLVTYARIALDRAAFVLSDLEQRTEAEEARYWHMRVEVADLQAPDRITEAAASMGLVYPDEVVTIEVPGLGALESETEDRWADLKALLSAWP